MFAHYICAFVLIHFNYPAVHGVRMFRTFFAPPGICSFTPSLHQTVIMSVQNAAPSSCLHSSFQSLLPFIDSRVNDSLLQTMPDVNLMRISSSALFNPRVLMLRVYLYVGVVVCVWYRRGSLPCTWPHKKTTLKWSSYYLTMELTSTLLRRSVIISIYLQ